MDIRDWRLLIASGGEHDGGGVAGCGRRGCCGSGMWLGACWTSRPCDAVQSGSAFAKLGSVCLREPNQGIRLPPARDSKPLLAYNHHYHPRLQRQQTLSCHRAGLSVRGMAQTMFQRTKDLERRGEAAATPRQNPRAGNQLPAGETRATGGRVVIDDLAVTTGLGAENVIMVDSVRASAVAIETDAMIGTETESETGRKITAGIGRALLAEMQHDGMAFEATNDAETNAGVLPLRVDPTTG
ncbi:hypothetical protein BC628DRAFT_482395 [Trametes gibbosa]|nr:hypothetical protein BC628DRAFT_482395 [Trametes gibbosa]